MKLAGEMLALIGAWGVLTLICAAAHSAGSSYPTIPYALAVQMIAPWTATFMLAVGCIVAGCWLYDKQRPE